MIRRAKRREPRASFRVGSFVDAPIPSCAAIIAIGEVFGYVSADMREAATLGAVFARCREALEPGGLLMFDLPGPGRLDAEEQRGWSAGPGWVVLVDAHVEGDVLFREIVTFRDCGRSRYRRSGETHRLQLHRPADVLAQLRANGFTARTLRPGYGTSTMPAGLTAYVGTRKKETNAASGSPAPSGSAATAAQD